MGIFKRKNTIFSNCKICGKETSKTGNLTNMVMAGNRDPEMQDPNNFNDKYGMMCSIHAMDVTKQIVSEYNIPEEEYQTAFEKAKDFVLSGH